MPRPVKSFKRRMHSGEARELWVSAVPMHRYGAPEELCGTINWLLDGGKSSYVTGQTISVDGGFTTTGLINH
ncbi:SDR family oxidoreductase [Paralcaligenes sp. KSB-10]|uniref:SDR family oxidoreductase n=1 Tax=Paralcaligenes sp. KSB-10 TaxID=2901142 RepID=UPI00351D2A96